MSRKPGGDWKDRLGVVYSTSDDFTYDYDVEGDTETLANADQKLVISLDKKKRGGKQVTLVTGFRGKEEDLKVLGKKLKSKCGVGGSAKQGEIIIQGDFREKVKELLLNDGYNVR
jgi:translation initiation factor 1